MLFLTVCGIIYYKKSSSTTDITITQVPFVHTPTTIGVFIFHLRKAQNKRVLSIRKKTNNIFVTGQKHKRFTSLLFFGANYHRCTVSILKTATTLINLKLIPCLKHRVSNTFSKTSM